MCCVLYTHVHKSADRLNFIVVVLRERAGFLSADETIAFILTIEGLNDFVGLFKQIAVSVASGQHDSKQDRKNGNGMFDISHC